MINEDDEEIEQEIDIDAPDPINNIGSSIKQEPPNACGDDGDGYLGQEESDKTAFTAKEFIVLKDASKGYEISLGSCKFSVEVLCDLALQLHSKLFKRKDNGRNSYCG